MCCFLETCSFIQVISFVRLLRFFSFSNVIWNGTDETHVIKLAQGTLHVKQDQTLRKDSYKEKKMVTIRN